tara:strand:- start:1079 stop:2041 length:963 start_codon:yes stop_codon:yes gene_type:complete
MKKVIETNPEFASEIVLSLPYVYWLYKHNMLDKVTVCKGMKPFYYFFDNVIEGFEYRTLDTSVGLKDIPNKWIHHNALFVTGKDHSELNPEEQRKVNGVLDYSEWECPNYTEHYSNKLFDDLKPFVVVNNIFNIEPGKLGFRPYRYFDIKNLYDIFDYLTTKGYNVIYKRPDNTEFTLDQNEVQTINSNLKLEADVDGVGLVNDYSLCDYFDNVININDLWKKHNDLDYSTLNLKLFAETDGFVSVNGGGSQFCACFGKPMVIYTTKGQELRPGYLENKDSYIKKLSSAPIHPIFDNFEDWDSNGGRNYSELINKVKEVF